MWSFLSFNNDDYHWRVNTLLYSKRRFTNKFLQWFFIILFRLLTLLTRFNAQNFVFSPVALLCQMTQCTLTFYITWIIFGRMRVVWICIKVLAGMIWSSFINYDKSTCVTLISHSPSCCFSVLWFLMWFEFLA
jgi:hypothetical protein